MESIDNQLSMKVDCFRAEKVNAIREDYRKATVKARNAAEEVFSVLLVVFQSILMMRLIGWLQQLVIALCYPWTTYVKRHKTKDCINEYICDGHAVKHIS